MNEPKIRFKGFRGEWEETTFDKSVTINSGMDYKHLAEGNIPVYGTGGYMLSVNESLSEVDAIGIGRKGTIDKPQLLKAPFWTVDTLFFMTPKNGNDLNFLYALSQKINWRNYDESTGVPSLSKLNIRKIEFARPDRNEQQSIASYFQHLDNLIQSTTKKIESLNQVKAASLQSMFPQEGETTPRVRFKGFEGEWEETPFSETFFYLKNNSLSRAELSDGGVVMNIHYGDVLIKYGECVDVGKEVKTFVKEEYIAKRLHQSCAITNGDIIFADAAEDNTVGKCSEIIANEDDAIISGLHTIPCRPMKQFATRYLGYYLNSNAYHNQLLPHIQGTKISSISKKAISQTHINSPLDISEQRAIASYFTNLDRQITLQTQRLEKLKQIKAACLDKMFV